MRPVNWFALFQGRTNHLHETWRVHATPYLRSYLCEGYQFSSRTARSSASLNGQNLGASSLWPDTTVAYVGGGGLFATVNYLLTINQGVLKGKLLRPETVKEMFQPHLENVTGLDKPDEYTSVYRNSIWNTVPVDVTVTFGIGGLMNTAAVPKRRGMNSLTWSGYPNCYRVGPLAVEREHLLTNSL